MMYEHCFKFKKEVRASVNNSICCTKGLYIIICSEHTRLTVNSQITNAPTKDQTNRTCGNSCHRTAVVRHRDNTIIHTHLHISTHKGNNIHQTFVTIGAVISCFEALLPIYMHTLSILLCFMFYVATSPHPNLSPIPRHF